MLLYIFTGIEIMFYWLGVITTLGVLGMFLLHKRYLMDWKSWLSLIFGAFLMVFAFAWAISSVLEGEPQAASMGIVFFGLPGIAVLLFARRMVLKCALRN